MIIAFCGHGEYRESAEDEQKILEILEREVGDGPCEFFLGGYGGFDGFSHSCAKKFKKEHPHAKLIFVTPYMDEKYIKSRTEYMKDVNVVYPPIENVPKKFAIQHRNRWMMEQADVVIAYVSRSFGGAYTTYKYAKTKKKRIYNISPRDVE